MSELKQLNLNQYPSRIIKVDIPEISPKEIVNLVLECENISDVWVRTATLSGISSQKWLKFRISQNETYYLKRALDIAGSIVSLIVLSPLFLIVSLLIKVNSSGSVIFQQPRITNRLKLFNLYKFRTMNSSSDNDDIHQNYMRNNIKNPDPNQKVHKLVNDPRITSVGKWIRKLSIDELPQLINILKGDMSFVGPRPPIPYEVKEYAEWHYARFKTKPGLTGLWQVSGRSLISFEEMILFDLYYAYNQSIWVDAKILFWTIPTVLSIRGAY